MTQVSSEKFAFAVAELLDEYSEEVTKVCHECTEETAEKMVKELKTKRSGKKPWKKFPRGWTKTIETKAWGSIEATVHLKKPHYRIGHLLEFGHAKRNGGRVQGFNFIAPVATEYENKYVEEMEKKIGAIS